MIGTIDIKCVAARPNQPLSPLFTFTGSPSSVRIMDVPKSIGDWNITTVRLVVKYPDNSTIVKNSVRSGSVWVATIQGTEITGKVSSGYEIVADGIDEDGNEVTGYVLGCGDVFVLNRDSKVMKDIEKFYVKYSDELPTTPAKGDLIAHNGNVRLFDGENWLTLGIDPIVVDKLEDEIEKVDEKVDEVASTIPTKTSELENDSGFYNGVEVQATVETAINELEEYKISPLSERVDGVQQQCDKLGNDIGAIYEELSYKATKDELPTKTSELENDSGFITSDDIPTNTKELVDEDETTRVVIKGDRTIIQKYVSSGWYGEAIVGTTHTDEYYIGKVNVEETETNYILSGLMQKADNTQPPMKWVMNNVSKYDIEIIADFHYDRNIVRVHCTKITTPMWIDYGRIPTDEDKYLGNETVATKDELPTKTSQLENDSGYVTASNPTLNGRVKVNGTDGTNTITINGGDGGPVQPMLIIGTEEKSGLLNVMGSNPRIVMGGKEVATQEYVDEAIGQVLNEEEF